MRSRTLWKRESKKVSKYNNSVDSIYYTINSVCNALKISKEVLLTFLDEVYVRANKNEKYGGNVPDEFNLGLSIIDRKRGLIVPKYARCDMQY